MSLLTIIIAKPVLIFLHLGLAIIGIDASLWVLGELFAGVKSRSRILAAAFIGLAGFILSWMVGGYYYVTVYGSEVKPIIKGGLAPWAHTIIMETKEHVFLFLIPLALTMCFLVFLPKEKLEEYKIKSITFLLVGWIVFLGLLVGTMGFIISAAARWG